MKNNNYGTEFFTKVYKQSVGKRVFIYLMSRGGIFLLLALYCLAGAYIFIKLERDYQTKADQAQVSATEHLDNFRAYVIKKIIYMKHKKYNKGNVSYIDGVQDIKSVLDEYHAGIVDMTNRYNWTGPETNETLNNRWSPIRAFIFCYTTLTLVGYGRIAPKTQWGRVFLIPYTILGILICMLFLGALTTDLLALLDTVYWKGFCHYFQKKRQRTRERRNSDFDVERDGILELPSRLPQSYAIGFIVIFLFLCECLIQSSPFYKWWEDWNYVESIYFMWITITTIGFGDYIPGYEELIASAAGKAKSIVMLGLLSVGLCLFAVIVGARSQRILHSDPEQEEKMIESLETHYVQKKRLQSIDDDSIYPNV